jgi:hypothetical protein
MAGLILIGSWLWLLIALICDREDFLEEYGWLIFLTPLVIGMITHS